MASNYFFYKLISPRPTFHLDMSDSEKSAMTDHMAYWEKLTEKRTSIVYGPVFDPEGVFGMAVIELDENEDPNGIPENDPAVFRQVCTYKLFPMQVGLLRK